MNSKTRKILMTRGHQNTNENTRRICVPGPRESRKADTTRCWRRGREKQSPGILMGMGNDTVAVDYSSHP